MKKMIFTLIAATSLLAATAQSSDNTIKQRTINVNGTAKLEIVPDEIYVNVQLQEYTKKNGDKIDLETMRNQFLAACKSIGINDSDVSVQAYSGWNGNYWWYQQNKKKNPDLKAGITYQVKFSSTKKMDELVDKLDDQATQSYSIVKTSSSKIEEYKKQLKIQAVKNAKEKAEYLAGAIDEKVGKALTINDPAEGNVYPQPVMYSMQAKIGGVESDAAAPMDVEYKKITLQFDVNVVFELN